MITIQTNDTTGGVVIFGNPACPPSAQTGYTIRTVDSLPVAPSPRNGAVLLWQDNALAWVAPTLTPQQTFNAAVAAGFAYAVPGSNPALALVLDLGDSARAQFTGLVVLIQAAMAAGQELATTNQSIADKAGTLHSLPVSEIIPMLLAYGNYYAGLFNTLHTATAASVT